MVIKITFRFKINEIVHTPRGKGRIIDRIKKKESITNESCYLVLVKRWELNFNESELRKIAKNEDVGNFCKNCNEYYGKLAEFTDGFCSRYCYEEYYEKKTENIKMVWKQQTDKIYQRRHQETKEQRKRYNRERKERIISFYSNGSMKCVNCGENNINKLCIDHIKNDGKEHRKIAGTSGHLYDWLIKESFPSGFQVLCFNCNVEKEILRRQGIILKPKIKSKIRRQKKYKPKSLLTKQEKQPILNMFEKKIKKGIIAEELGKDYSEIYRNLKLLMKTR